MCTTSVWLLLFVFTRMLCWSCSNLCLGLSNLWARRFTTASAGVFTVAGVSSPIMRCYRDEPRQQWGDCVCARGFNLASCFLKMHLAPERPSRTQCSHAFWKNKREREQQNSLFLPIRTFFWNIIRVVQQFKSSVSYFSSTQRIQNITPRPLERERWLVAVPFKPQ